MAVRSLGMNDREVRDERWNDMDRRPSIRIIDRPDLRVLLRQIATAIRSNGLEGQFRSPGLITGDHTAMAVFFKAQRLRVTVLDSAAQFVQGARRTVGHEG